MLNYDPVGSQPTVTIGRLNMVDLAGSERVKTTGITAGKRMEEMKKINTSLTAFGKHLMMSHSFISSRICHLNVCSSLC